MKRLWKKILVVLLGAVTLVVVYRLVFSYTIYRIHTSLVGENIMGVKFTTVNMLNPFKVGKAKAQIKLALNALSDTVLKQEKKEYLEENLYLDDDFEILDMYEKDGEIYVFTSFKVKDKETVINKLLFLCDTDYEVKKVLF